MMFQLYESPRSATLFGKMVTVLGVVIDPESRVRYVIVSDIVGDKAEVLHPVASQSLQLYVGPAR